MSMLRRDVEQIRDGSKRAMTAGLPQLGHLLRELADVGELVADGDYNAATILLPQALERAARLAGRIRVNDDVSTSDGKVA